MSIRMKTLSSAAVAVSGVAFAAVSFAAQHNTTGLPSYPHDGGGLMDETYRSIPNGQNCMHYQGDTPDALADVIAWYKKQMPAARADDINKDSLYGNYFKLDGIKLLLGNDIVNIYRMKDQTTTSIELFKCRDAPRG